MFSFFKNHMWLSDVWLFLSSKKLGCFTHIMNIDPKFFLHKTYSKFRLSENIYLVWKNKCSFDHLMLWLSDLWRILKIVLPYDIVKANVAEQVGICTYLPITLLFTIRKLKKKILNFVWSPIFHIGSLIIGLFDDLGWCPILAQIWVRSDTNGLKKNGTPWWQNQWFRLCNQWSHNSHKLFWRKNPQKILLSIFNIDLNVNKCPILPLFTDYTVLEHVSRTNHWAILLGFLLVLG